MRGSSSAGPSAPFRGLAKKANDLGKILPSAPRFGQDQEEHPKCKLDCAHCGRHPLGLHLCVGSASCGVLAPSCSPHCTHFPS